MTNATFNTLSAVFTVISTTFAETLRGEDIIVYLEDDHELAKAVRNFLDAHYVTYIEDEWGVFNILTECRKELRAALAALKAQLEQAAEEPAEEEQVEEVAAEEQVAEEPAVKDEHLSNLFKKAHQIARETVAAVGDYRIAFQLALKSLWTVEKLTAMGCSEWVKGGYHRVYFNDHTDEVLEKFFGLSILRYKTGNIRYAELNGEQISNCQARRMVAPAPYYNVASGEFVGIHI